MLNLTDNQRQAVALHNKNMLYVANGGSSDNPIATTAIVLVAILVLVLGIAALCIAAL